VSGRWLIARLIGARGVAAATRNGHAKKETVMPQQSSYRIKTQLTPRLLLALLLAAGVAVIGTPPAHARNQSDATAQRATQDQSSALVILNGDPLSTYVKTKPAKGKKIDFSSNTVKSYRAQLSALRNDYKKWLRANYPKAKVTGEFDISLNAVAVQLNGASLAGISATPLVKTAQYQGLYYPNVVDPDLALIHAVEAWAVGGGPANAGAGVKVAVVDTGIDATHPCFADTDYAGQTQLGDTRFTNNKVIAAKVFNNKAGVNRYTPEALQDHGTHVAGTVACNHETPATVQGVTIPYAMSGVAPRALLGNYNVFPGAVDSARSEDILNALDAAYQDGFDVANMSLGGGAHGIQDLLTIAVDNLDQANMVVAVAAGNSGPGFGTVESPGSAARALTAGASTVPHFVGAPVTAASNTYGAATGDFAVVSANLTAELDAVPGTTNGLSTACSALPAGSLTGKIALISRGVCAFSAKIRNAQAAGAVAVLVANNVAGDPIAMGSDGTPNQPTVPAYMVSRSDGGALLGVDGASTTIGAALSYFATTNADIMAGFSSQGPTDVDFRVKPDVVAPGVNVLSSIPAAFCAAPPCFAFFQGTSMATPHLAGSAAVVRGQHPTWSAADVRSAIVNTADRGVLKNFSTAAIEMNLNIIGAGRENLANAVAAIVALDPVSVSFGAVPSGSGQTQSFNVTLRNLSGGSQTLSLAVVGGDSSVSYSLNKSAVTLLANESTDVTVTMTAVQGAAAGGHQGHLEISSGGAAVAHAVLYTLIK
jgi:subtilisin family serine protease